MHLTLHMNDYVCLNLPTKTHNSCDTLKLANGKHGRISGFFEKVVRHSGVNSGSKLGKVNANDLI